MRNCMHNGLPPTPVFPIVGAMFSCNYVQLGRPHAAVHGEGLLEPSMPCMSAATLAVASLSMEAILNCWDVDDIFIIHELSFISSTPPFFRKITVINWLDDWYLLVSLLLAHGQLEDDMYVVDVLTMQRLLMLVWGICSHVIWFTIAIARLLRTSSCL